MHNMFDADRYALIDKATGEEIPTKIFIEKKSADRWEKSYAQLLAVYINCAGDKSSQFLSYLIENRDTRNRVFGTQLVLSQKAGVSERCAKKVLKTLKEKGLIKMVQSGLYMISPRMISVGRDAHAAALMHIYCDLGKPKNKQKNPLAVFDLMNEFDDEAA